MFKVLLIFLFLSFGSFASEKLFIEYIDNLKTISSNFMQYDSNTGNMSEGLFYVEKPKKVRFEYTNPFNTLLIANGNVITYYDIDLDEISTIPAKSTPINIFLGMNSSSLNILNIYNEDDKTVVKTKTSIGSDNYNIDYIFDNGFKNLKGINFSNGNGESLEIELFNTKINTKLDKNLFIFRNPRLYKRK